MLSLIGVYSGYLSKLCYGGHRLTHVGDTEWAKAGESVARYVFISPRYGLTLANCVHGLGELAELLRGNNIGRHNI